MKSIITQLPQYSFDYDKIKTEIYSIIKENPGMLQIGLTHSEKAITERDKLLESTGSIFDYENRVFKFRETDFTIFNETYRHTYLYEVYNSVPDVGRFRIMIMNGPACYSIHRDLSMRYHYVIDTNPECLFLFPDAEKQFHIPCDKNLYIVDTRFRHTFVNGSRSQRIHLVFDDLSTLIT